MIEFRLLQREIISDYLCGALVQSCIPLSGRQWVVSWPCRRWQHARAEIRQSWLRGMEWVLQGTQVWNGEGSFWALILICLVLMEDLLRDRIKVICCQYSVPTFADVELVRMQNVFTNIHSDVSCWVGQGWAQFYLAHWEWILIWEHLFGMWRDNKESKLGVVAQVCQPSILVGTGRRTASSRPAWAIQWFQGSVHNLRKPYFKVRKVRKEPVLNTCFIYGRSCI